MNEPSTDFVYPEDVPDESAHNYRAASRHFLRVMNIQADYVVRSDNPHVAVWATAYALGLAICEGVSITDRAYHLGITPQALSKAIKEAQNKLNL